MTAGDLSLHTNVRPDAVRGQIERIVASPRFAASPQLCAFLRYIAEEALAGRAEGIKAYSIATEALGRCGTFDAEADPIVRVQGARLRKLLDLYAATDGADDPLCISIPKGRYVPLIERRAADPGTEPLAAPACCGSSGTPLDRPVISVLACGSLSALPEHGALCETLAEDILVALDRFETLDTAPIQGRPGAVMDTGDAIERGRAAGADFVLQLKLCIRDAKAALHVRLTDLETGLSAWSEKREIEGDPGAGLALPTGIAGAIASQIAEPLGYAHRSATWATSRCPVDELTPYQSVLQSHLYHVEANPQSFARALSAAHRAADLLPDCGTAWATLAELYGEGYRIGYGGVRATQGYLDLACASAKRAYQLCPECAYSTMAVADVHFAKGELDRGARLGETALAQNPNDHAIKARFGLCMAYAGEWELGVRHIEQALAHQPVALASYNHLLAERHFLNGEFRRSLELIERGSPSLPFFEEMGKAANFAALGEREEARRAVSRLSLHWPDFTLESLDAVLQRDMEKPVAARFLDSLREAGVSA